MTEPSEIKTIETRTVSRSVSKTCALEEPLSEAQRAARGGTRSFVEVTITVGSTSYAGEPFPPPTVFVSAARSFTKLQWETIDVAVFRLFIAYEEKWPG